MAGSGAYRAGRPAWWESHNGPVTDRPAPATDPADPADPAGPADPLRADDLRAALCPTGGPDDPVGRLEVVDRTGSTSTDLLASAVGPWAGPVLRVAGRQDAGRGRSGHGWQVPPGQAATFSLAVRPRAPRDTWGWLPLLAGLGVVRAVRAATGVVATLKWPNDVLVPADRPVPGWGSTRKVAGLLAEVAGDGRTVVVGIGLNVHQGAAGLPVPWAGSLAQALGAAQTGPAALTRLVTRTGATANVSPEPDGARPDRAALLDRTALVAAAARAVLDLFAAWDRQDAVAGGLRRQVAEVCATLGARVRADLPGGGEVTGDALRLADDGALVLATEAGEVEVRAGDLHHVRQAGDLGFGV